MQQRVTTKPTVFDQEDEKELEFEEEEKIDEIPKIEGESLKPAKNETKIKEKTPGYKELPGKEVPVGNIKMSKIKKIITNKI